MKKFKIIATIFCMFMLPKITTSAINKNIFPTDLLCSTENQNQQENEDIENESISTLINEYEIFNEIEEQEALEEEEERLRNSNSYIEEENEKESEGDEETTKYYEENLKFLVKEIEKIIEE